MKQIVNISLGASRDDYELQTRFLGKRFHIRRFGTDGDLEKAADLLLRWNKQADAIGLGSVKLPYTVGATERMEKETEALYKLGAQMKTPVTGGDRLRLVIHEWSLRHLQFQFGNNYFDNARVFFFSGLVNATLAQVMSEFTENLTFADPVLRNGVPRLLASRKQLEVYASNLQTVLQWIPGKRIASRAAALRAWNDRIVRKAVQRAHIVVIPYCDFYDYVGDCTARDLSGKIVITSTAYDDRIEFLKRRDVDVIIDTTPKVLERVVGISVLEAMVLVALGKTKYQLTYDDLLEVLSDTRMDPRVIYPKGRPRRVNRFAFVIHPLSQDTLRRMEPIEALAKTAPPGVMDVVERVAAHAPPFVYSKVTGIRSPTGVEAEGWLITLGATAEALLDHGPEFTARRLLEASKLAKRLGAQVMGIATLPKGMEDVAIQVAKQSEVPVTTGNSYVASSALWAAADAVRRMGLIQLEHGKILKAKTLVVGATGAVGSICCRLLAKAFEEVHLVGRNTAKLLALQESIEQESPGVKIHVSTRADKVLPDMDVIVAASAGASKDLDIRKVKPGCVITDVTRPLIFTPEDVNRRPDVLVIKGGRIRLPGRGVHMRDIGLPRNVVSAGLAETILLALEGRFEGFTIGSETEWQKVREIYRLGLRHGMNLAAISGLNGVFSDADIARVRELALEAQARKRGPGRGSRSRTRKQVRAAQASGGTGAARPSRNLPADPGKGAGST